MEGEDCRAIELGNVADKTGGKVSFVCLDPKQYSCHVMKDEQF